MKRLFSGLILPLLIFFCVGLMISIKNKLISNGDSRARLEGAYSESQLIKATALARRN